MKKRFLATFLVLCLVLELLINTSPVAKAVYDAQETLTGDFVVTGGASGVDYTYTDGVLSILSGTPLEISNQNPSQATTDTIFVANGVSADITLAGINIDVGDTGDYTFDDDYHVVLVQGKTALKIADDSSGNVKITLKKETDNYLRSGYYHAGIEKNGDTTTGMLTITGEGSLNASNSYGAAGIGGGRYKTTSNITIESGTIAATAGNSVGYCHGGAGIGGSNGDGNNITIKGGIITAQGGYSGPGIGGDNSTITITGGTIKAVGGTSNAGIGGGSGSESTQQVSITGGVIMASGGGPGSNKGAGAAIGWGGELAGAGKEIAGTNWSGIVFRKNVGSAYGSNLIIDTDMTIPDGYRLLVSEGKNITIASNTTVTIPGKEGLVIDINANVKNDGTIKIFDKDCLIGTVSGNRPIIYGSSGVLEDVFRWNTPINKDTEMDWEYTYSYDESWFSKDSTEYQHDLVKMSLCVAMAAFGAYDKTLDTGPTYTKKNIKALFSDLGFDNSNTVYYYHEPTLDSVGYAIGSKSIVLDSGENCSLVLVAVRGGGYGVEWGGNFRITGDDGQLANKAHMGFSVARDQVIEGIKDYFKNNTAALSPNCKIWITGYSRAAATTNLVAKELDDQAVDLNGISIKKKDIYAFCFECPQNTTAPDATNEKYSNIINIVNPVDFVTKVAMSKWNFTRYGRTLFLPYAEGKGESYEELHRLMYTAYSSIAFRNGYDLKVHDFKPMHGQASILDRFMNNLAIVLVSPWWYYSSLNQDAFITLATDFLGSDKKDPATLASAIWGIGDLAILAKIYPINSGLVSNLIFTNTFFSGHYPEFCLAWLNSLSGDIMDFTPSTYREVFINCPVDVYIYNSSRQLVAQITDGAVQEIDGGLVAYIDDNEQKVIALPNSEAYTIELTATDNGSVTYTVTEYNIDSSTTEKVVSYYEIDVSNGDKLTGLVEDLDEIPAPSYPLYLNDESTSLVPTITQDVAAEYNVKVTVSGNGNAYGSGAYVNGTFAKVIVATDNIEEFQGWYLDDSLVSTEDEYRFLVDKDINIVAKFGESPSTDVYVLTVTNGTGSGNYAAGDQVAITANSAPDGKMFDKWTTDNGGTFTDVSNASTTFTMPTSDVTITATYKDSGVPPAPGRHIHSWATAWSSNATHHWHECTASGCDITNNSEKNGYGAHIYNNVADTTCNDCGYTRTVTPPSPEHTHNWAATWTTSATHHWHNCIVSGCDITSNHDKNGYGEHVYDDITDDTCNTCGYTRVITPPVPEHTHNWSATWSSDVSHHWHDCTASGCDITSNNDKNGYGEHVYDDDTDDTCNTCGYTRTVTPPVPEHTHNWSATWSSDVSHHWHDCTASGCDITSNNDKNGYGEHVYDDDTDDTCNTCGYTRTVTPPVPEHTHNWSAAWSSDATHHWHDCTANGCDITNNSGKDGYGEHIYNHSSDATCNICGYIRDVAPSSDDTNYIAILKTDNGEIISSTRYAAQGERVTLSAHPAAGYELESVTVTDVRGRTVTVREVSDNRYTFTMPATRVEVAATFIKTEADTTPKDDELFTGLGTPGISGIVLNPAPLPFTDVQPQHWFYDNVDYVWKRYLMSGVSDTRFAPQLTTSRAMIWTILARMNNVRTDVNPGATWYERGMLWAMEQGVTDGTNPMGDITREQLAAMLWRNAGRPAPGDAADLTQFRDSNAVSGYAQTAVRWAVSVGILNGSNGEIDPQGTATRAQVASMAARYGDRFA